MSLSFVFKVVFPLLAGALVLAVVSGRRGMVILRKACAVGNSVLFESEESSIWLKISLSPKRSHTCYTPASECWNMQSGPHTLRSSTFRAKCTSSLLVLCFAFYLCSCPSVALPICSPHQFRGQFSMLLTFYGSIEAHVPIQHLLLHLSLILICSHLATLSLARYHKCCTEGMLYLLAFAY